VQSDAAEARRRGIERDVAGGRERDEVGPFWDEWMEEEVRFLAADRPWERADLVFCGTPAVLSDPPAPPPPGVLLVSAARPGGR